MISAAGKAVVRPELETLFLCARRTTDAKRLTDLVAGGLDWRLLGREAAWHGLIPILRRHLDQIPCAERPEDLWRWMRAHAAAVAVNNAKLLDKLGELGEALKSQGIPMIALKGPVLAHRLFGDPLLRPCSDLDILVRPQDAARTATVMQDLGYAAANDAMIRWQSEWIRSSYEMQFASSASGVRVDLHWRWYHPNFRFVPDQETIWSRSREVALEGGRFRTLDDIDEVLYLVIHAARHDWEALRWLMDIAEALRGMGSAQWRAIDERAAEWRVRRKWLVTAALCERCLQVFPSPERATCEDARASQIVNEVLERWNRGAPAAPCPPALPWKTLFYRSLEWPADRRRILFEWLAKPSALDWDFCSVPDSLWPLYAVLRPLRVVAQQAGRAYSKYFPRG